MMRRPKFRRDRTLDGKYFRNSILSPPLRPRYSLLPLSNPFLPHPRAAEYRLLPIASASSSFTLTAAALPPPHRLRVVLLLTHRRRVLLLPITRHCPPLPRRSPLSAPPSIPRRSPSPSPLRRLNSRRQIRRRGELGNAVVVRSSSTAPTPVVSSCPPTPAHPPSLDIPASYPNFRQRQRSRTT
uniref:Uncharacterized protein n=1 Tax=Oryza nivara TaxID=4536 RepID=A0A0E0FM63_ORYNI